LPAASTLDAVSRQGLRAPAGGVFRLYESLDAAACAGAPVLVVDTTQIPEATEDPSSAEPCSVSRVPPNALRNVAPYRVPVALAAGGGYVARMLPGTQAADDVALLLIFRRGVWDLPKGKQDPGETLADCALREVREEVGIQHLVRHTSLGVTTHGYVENDAYVVKTTHWYLMRTPERCFTPELQEGIRRVAWARWEVARSHIGYETLAAHMDRVELRVRSALDALSPIQSATDASSPRSSRS